MAHKKKRHHGRKGHHKPTPKAKKKVVCDRCGESEHGRVMVVQIDGKTEYRWHLCRMCCAVKTVAVGSN